MFQIGICDDDVQVIEKLEELLHLYGQKNYMETEIKKYQNGKDLEKAVKAGYCFDFIYLDIEMEKQDGILTAENIRQYDKNVLIVFVTNHESYMRESFIARPFRFLLKPVNEEEFEYCFLDLCMERSREDFYFRYRYNKVYYKIPIRNIRYFESRQRKIIIHTINRDFILYGKINEIETYLENLNQFFLRVHQSYLVNYNYIERQSYDYVVMDDGLKISISENRRNQVRDLYCAAEDIFYGKP